MASLNENGHCKNVQIYFPSIEISFNIHQKLKCYVNAAKT